MRAAAICIFVGLAGFGIASAQTKAPSDGRAGFVSLAELDPSIAVEARYYESNNFVGRRITGYKAAKCLLTKEAAQALKTVQDELKPFKLSLRVFDCYRPQRAVNDFVAWAKDLKDVKMKGDFYPKVAKEKLFEQGYIAEKSGHTRGSTVDLTIDGLVMGTEFDFFDPKAHTANDMVPSQARANRLLLKHVMEGAGFKNLDVEWWHYTLKDEPYPETYFEFDVE